MEINDWYKPTIDCGPETPPFVCLLEFELPFPRIGEPLELEREKVEPLIGPVGMLLIISETGTMRSWPHVLHI